jgi:hypothetical protein
LTTYNKYDIRKEKLFFGCIMVLKEKFTASNRESKKIDYEYVRVYLWGLICPIAYTLYGVILVFCFLQPGWVKYYDTLLREESYRIKIDPRLFWLGMGTFGLFVAIINRALM